MQNSAPKKKKKKKAKLSDAQELKVIYHNSKREGSPQISNKEYEELARLQVELVKMQYWGKP